MGREGPTGGNYFSGLIDDVAIWKRALTDSEVAALHGMGRTGSSLGDLIRQPTALLVSGPIREIPGGQIEVDFQSLWNWTNFRLLKADSVGGPYLPVYGLAPTSLGRGFYRFTCPKPTSGQVYFRIEAQ
jgi:hypothetical protein